MRPLLALSLVLAACSGPAATGSPDAGAPVAEPFAAIGSPTEGIAIGRTAGGVPMMYASARDNRIVRIAPDGAVSDFVSIADPLGIAVRDDGTLIVCGRQPASMGSSAALFAVDPSGAISTLVAAGPEGVAFTRTNFVAIAPDGSIVFSDSGGGRVFRADADGADVALVTDAISFPNGLAFAPDGRTLYVASWDSETVHALSFDPSSGAYGAPSFLIGSIANVDGIVTTSTGALVLVTTSQGILLADPPAAPEPLVPASSIVVPANAVFGEGAYGASKLYLSALGETSIWVVHTDLMAP